jgi:hypothetical protein
VHLIRQHIEAQQIDHRRLDPKRRLLITQTMRKDVDARLFPVCPQLSDPRALARLRRFAQMR